MIASTGSLRLVDELILDRLLRHGPDGVLEDLPFSRRHGGMVEPRSDEDPPRSVSESV